MSREKGYVMKRLIVLLSFLSVLSCAEKKETKSLQPQPLGVKRVENKYGRKTYNLDFHPKVDILFIVDDSLSMDAHQQRFSSNVDAFVSGFFNSRLIDYHIGVLTSSMKGDQRKGVAGNLYYVFEPYVDKNTPDASAVLKQNLMPGIGGDGDERFFEPVVKALSTPIIDGFNKGFYRKDAYLVLVYITDTDDHGQWSPELFYSFLLRLKNGDAKKIISYGAVIPRGGETSQCIRNNTEVPPDKLIEFIKGQTHGSYFSLCSENFGEEMAQIGKSLEEKLEFFVPLKKLPDVKTIVVKWGNQVIPQDRDRGWVYDITRAGIQLGKGIVLKDEPSAQLKITFDEAQQ